ncbi:N-acetyltransferase [Salipiger sp. IMCC34102]|uniref:GNAT family N-acetyltransferase n=1 Tax=Salipiger sp. IMCC34102 TaxID=2510647 RepID=UPI00101C7DDF|nr:GNAT family N-acetyltransferase [Salipiger sp. IMCC34102]RYH03104.1 N-acetyltransferase [Salipiger sp. IMCC34102]
MDDVLTRPPRAGDWRDLHAIASHWPTVRQMGSWPWPPQEAFTRSRSRPYDGDGFVWALEQAGRVIGSVAITGEELGYMLHPDAAGQGIVSRIAGAAIDHAFRQMGRRRLVASVWEDNPASYRVLSKLGFVHWQTAYVRGAVRYPTRSFWFRLSRDRWRTLSAPAQSTRAKINPERPGP